MTLTFETHSTSLTHLVLGSTCIDLFQSHRSIGSGAEDFLRFLPYMGISAMLVM